MVLLIIYKIFNNSFNFIEYFVKFIILMHFYILNILYLLFFIKIIIFLNQFIRSIKLFRILLFIYYWNLWKIRLKDKKVNKHSKNQIFIKHNKFLLKARLKKKRIINQIMFVIKKFIWIQLLTFINYYFLCFAKEFFQVIKRAKK